MEPHRLKYGVRTVIPETSDELIRVDGLDVELAKNRGREIAQLNVTMTPAPP